MFKQALSLLMFTFGVSFIPFSVAHAQSNEATANVALNEPSSSNNTNDESAPATEKNKPIKENKPFSITPVVNPDIVANFPLDEAFLNKMANVHKQIPSLPKEPDNPQYGNDTSITGLIAMVEFKPKLMKLLSDNGLSAQDYVVGSMALAATLAAASAEGEEQFFDEANSVSPANLEFGKKHIDEIRVILEE